MSSGDTRQAYRTSELLAFATALFRCRRQARSADVHLYPGIMDALAPWAERFDVVPPAPAN